MIDYDPNDKRTHEEYVNAPKADAGSIFDTTEEAPIMGRKLSYVAVFTMQIATGPNPQNRTFEVVDENDDRLSYVNSIQEAATDIANCLDPHDVVPHKVVWDDVTLP